MSKVVASYFYCDPSGNPLARIDRIEPGWHGRSKEFLPYASDGKGGYNRSPGLNGVKLPLYHLDEVFAAIEAGATVYITEGEGKADDLRSTLRAAELKGAGTAVQGGASAPMCAKHVASLAGAPRVVILADSDETGRRAARSRGQRIADRHPSCDVRIVDLYPARSDGSDVADWLAEGHTLAELYSLCDQAERMPQSPAALVPRVLSSSTATASANQWVTVGGLLAEPEVDAQYLVDGLLLDGGTSLVVAKPKVGKSTLAQDLAFSVARGEPFLGRATKRGSVLYLALEEKRSELRRHFRAIGADADDELAFYVGRAPEGAVTWLEGEVAKRKPLLIILDTLQLFTRLRDINDYAAVTNALGPLTQLARESGAHLMFTHHGKKSGGADGDAVLGSTGLFGAVDTLLEMRRRDGVRSLSAIQRYGEDLEPTVIALDPDTYRLSPQGSTSEGNRKRVETAMLQHFEATTEPETREQVFEAVEAQGALKTAALKVLVECGKILRTGDGKRSSPFLYSRSPVPTIYAEQENKNPEIAEIAHKVEPDSCSRDSREVSRDGNDNSHAENPDELFAYANERIPRRDDSAPCQTKLDL